MFVVCVDCSFLWFGFDIKIGILVCCSVLVRVVVYFDLFMIIILGIVLFVRLSVCVIGVKVNLCSIIVVVISVNVSGVIIVLFEILIVVRCLLNRFVIVIRIMLCGLVRVISVCFLNGILDLSSDRKIMIGWVIRMISVINRIVCVFSIVSVLKLRLVVKRIKIFDISRIVVCFLNCCSFIYDGKFVFVR